MDRKPPARGDLPGKEPQRISSLEELEPQFRGDVRALIADLAHEDLPISVFETRRSLARQDWLAAKGVSRATGPSGPHPYGLAIDIVLDPDHPSWPARGGAPIRVGGAGAPWDTGIELRALEQRDEGTQVVKTVHVCQVIRPHVLEVVMRLGQLAEEHGLQWGGRNEGLWASSRKGDLLGWDPFHFQRRHWRGLVRKLPPPT